ncbi:hypothetical protein [Oligoflexus tunisiensis]|uniref:hypothetical protein n=1 Tax=Oligoflexus tunisiensis TaxID=708132 RepID=UPI00114CEFE8|nr:hypothetical protein [Oligoflexus tunisiensis]
MSSKWRSRINTFTETAAKFLDVKFRHSIHALKKRAIRNNRWAIFLLFFIFSVWPIKTKQHSLVPHFARQEFGFSDIKPWIQGINKQTPAVFKVIIGLDFAENTNTRSSLEHELFSHKMTSEGLQSRARAYPWRYAQSIAFPIATFNRKNHCTLKVILSNGLSSDFIDCEDISDNQLVSFHFNQWIKPGIYSLRFESTAEPGQEIAPYYSEDKDNQPWILPFQGKLHVNFLDYFRALLFRDPAKASIYGIGLALLLLFISGTWPFSYKAIFIYISVVFFANLASLPFSGYDETAHISMFQEAAKDRLEIKSDQTFNKEVWLAMAESDFFRLHSVDPKISDACPHSIVGHCGVTAPPIRLYSTYVKILELFGFKEVTPLRIIRFAQFLNAFLILSVLGLARVFLNTSELAAFVLSLSFLGGMIAQSPSLTNDIPLFILGCLCLLSAATIIQKSITKGIISLLITSIFFHAVRNFDISSVTALPFLCALIVLLMIKGAVVRTDTMPPSQISFGKALLFFLGFILCIIVCVGIFKSMISEQYFLSTLSEIEGRVLLLRDLERLDFENSVNIIVSYWRSYIGSYVWGHSYWPNIYYVFSAAAYIAAVISGLRILKSKASPRVFYTSGITLAALIATQVVIILSIASEPSSAGDQVFRDSYTKVRLSAPIAPALLILPALTGSMLSFKSKMVKLLWLWLIIFALASAILLPTKFFLADIF